MTTWINREDIKLSEISQKYKIGNVSTYMWNLKTKQMDKYNKTEIDSQTQNECLLESERSEISEED